MYSYKQLRKGINDPILFAIEANRLYYRRLYLDDYNTKGIDIFNEDWDNLILLDACRYDIFSNRSTLPGKLKKKISRGSSTREFLQGNFSNRELLDTVYITSNPQFYKYRSELNTRFHDVIHLWKGDKWDENLGTVHPETTTKSVIKAAETYPHKRLLIHFIQPHYPFIRSNTEFDKGQLDRFKTDDFWNKLTKKELQIPKSEIWSAYRDNLDLVLPFVNELLDQLNGRIIVTSDHGNMFGERAFPIPIRLWGHPRGIHTNELVSVPWLIIEGNQRPKITSDDPLHMNRQIESDTVQNRLEDLGYMER